MNRRIDLRVSSILVNDLRLQDAQQFKIFIRISAVAFQLLLDLVQHEIVNYQIH